MIAALGKVCPACSEVSLLGSNGQCGACFGSGQNVSLVEADPLCPRCGGSGICPVCQGSGFVPRNGVAAPANTRSQRIALLGGGVVAIVLIAVAAYAFLSRRFDLRLLALGLVVILVAIRIYVRATAKTRAKARRH